MKIVYGKMGRSVLLHRDKWGPVGGDNEPLHLLLDLATTYPEHTFIIGGRHSGDPGDLPANVVVPELPKVDDWVKGVDAIAELYEDADGVVMWLGQHGSVNMPIPKVSDRSQIAKPQESFKRYCAPIVEGINRWRDVDPIGREEVWLCADTRNYLKARDLRWPNRLPILGQFDKEREHKNERGDDTRDPAALGFVDARWSSEGLWIAPQRYVGSGLELTGVPTVWEPVREFADRVPFGIVINEARAAVARDRATIVRDWVMPLGPDFIHGKWSPEGQETIGTTVEPIHYDRVRDALDGALTTLTTPSSGSGWATAKPWECFSTGTICFFHPEYDTQGHIIPTLEQIDGCEDGSCSAGPNVINDLARWLRVRSPKELAARVEAVASSRETYEWLRDAQLAVLNVARDTNACVTSIAQRTGIAS